MTDINEEKDSDGAPEAGPAAKPSGSSKQIRFVVLVVVLLNIVFVGGLLLSGEKSCQGAWDALTEDGTMASTRFDFSDQADEMNVIFISMDALRWDRTGLSGNEDGLTPNIDAFAESAVVFHNATSAAPWTLPSHMAVWTGRWPSVHEVTNKMEPTAGGTMIDSSLSKGITTYPDLLIQSGRLAGGFTGGAGVHSQYGFGRGFDSYLDDVRFGGMDHSMAPAMEWVKENRASPFFLFLHGYDSHGQFDLPVSQRQGITGFDTDLDGSIDEQAGLREQGLKTIVEPGQAIDLTGVLDEQDAAFLEKVYDLKVRNADQLLGNFMDFLRAEGLYDNTIVVLFSDHGDEFLEHKGLDHGSTLYQEQLHVMMMMHFPGYDGRIDIDAPVRTIDIFPTVFDALQLEGPKDVDGSSLLPILRDPAELAAYSPKILSETDYRLFARHRMIREGDYKLILDLLDGNKELYNISEDPGETRNIANSDAKRSYEMEQRLRKWMGQVQTNPDAYRGLKETPITVF
jgi:hypothetical protein